MIAEILLVLFFFVVVDVIVVLVLAFVLVHVIAVDPRNLPLKFGQHQISNS